MAFESQFLLTLIWCRSLNFLSISFSRVNKVYEACIEWMLAHNLVLTILYVQWCPKVWDHNWKCGLDKPVISFIHIFILSACLPSTVVKCFRVMWRIYVYIHGESSVSQRAHQVWLFTTHAVLQDVDYSFMAVMSVSVYVYICGLQWINGYLSLMEVHKTKKVWEVLL